MIRSISRLFGGTLLALLAMAPLASTAQAESAAERRSALHKATTAAFRGPEVKKLKINGHEFNVKPARITGGGGSITVQGQISHHLSLRPDDQMYYTIKKSNGVVTSLEIKVDEGGIAPYAGKLVKHFVKLPLVDEAAEATIRKLGGLIDGNWRSASELIVAAIALRANDGSPGPVVRDHRTPTVAQPFNVQVLNQQPSMQSTRAPGGVMVTPTVKPIIRDHRQK